MKVKDFYYDLPENLIAQTPIEPRDNSKLLILDKTNGNIVEKRFFDLEELLGKNDVLVVNKTRVINARLYGELDIFCNGERKTKKVEVFLLKQMSQDTWECLGYPGRNLKVGKSIRFYSQNGELVMNGFIEKNSKIGKIIRFDKDGASFFEVVNKSGQLPLPPYIKEKIKNPERYQTVFSSVYGSVAAPTAGLHFTKRLIQKLQKNGVIIEKVLLHVSAGTFKPVKTENVEEHEMHSEFIEIEKDVSERLNRYKLEGRNIIAIGTTSVRVLESFSSDDGTLGYGSKETSIFIYPGYRWKFVNSLITNFHLPESTLLMLVSALAGIENTKKAYDFAIKNNYRFLSFGDAMRIK